MTGRGQIEFQPGRVHRCNPPNTGGSQADPHLPIGTVWKCLDGTPTCGKRWRVAFIDSAFGGDLGWARRRLPWRPIFGNEHPPKRRVES